MKMKMTRLSSANILVLILLAAGLSACVNLKYVNSFSSSSFKSVGTFEEIDYSFTANCLENCQDKVINDLNLRPGDCNCKADEKADSVTFLIYNAIKGYFDGLTRLSDNDLVSFKLDPLTDALTEGNLGPVKIDKTQAEAYSNISGIILRAFTDQYRKERIKEYVTSANEPLKVLISYLDFNLSANLAGKLNVQKQRIESYYFDLTTDTTLSTFEKREALEEYFLKLGKIETRQGELLTYSKALRKIASGHQKLVDNIDKLTGDDLKAVMSQYASDIQTIISEFNKIGE